MNKHCLSCQEKLTDCHPNRKYCKPCGVTRKPKGNLTEHQKAEAIKLRGTMPITKIANELGVSVSNIKRSLPGISFYYENGKIINNPQLAREIYEYYLANGKPKTLEKFKDCRIRPRSIIDAPAKYGFLPQQKIRKWTDDELVELARMQGLISYQAQAKYFSRPNANAGSIKSAYQKKFSSIYSELHGMSWSNARKIVYPDCPKLFLPTLERMPSKNATKNKNIRVLWCDLEKHLLPVLPPAFVDAIKALAEFQRWLFQTENPRAKILNMLRTREYNYEENQTRRAQRAIR